MGHYRTETLIPRNNVDIMLKVITERFAENALRFYGVEASKVKSVEPTELMEIIVSEKRMDFVFLLEDDSYLHLEFQTKYRKQDLERFLQYDVSLYRKRQKRIKTVVVYGSGVPKADAELDIGSVNYRVHTVFMDRFDGDQHYRGLYAKIVRGEVLSEDDQLHLILLPLMYTETDRSVRVEEALQLANRVSDSELRALLVSYIRGLSNKFFDKGLIRELREGIGMSDILELLYEVIEEEVIEKGRIQEAKLTAQVLLEQRFGQSSESLQEKISKVAELSIIRKVVLALAGVRSLPEAEEAVENILTLQH